MPRVYARKLRVAAELHRLLNELLVAEVRDPRLAGVRINDVELSGDLSVAKVFFGTLELDRDPVPIEQALQKAGGFLRSRVGRSLRIRRLPELRFVHDVSAKRGLELTRLIEDLAADAPDEDPSDGQSSHK